MRTRLTTLTLATALAAPALAGAQEPVIADGVSAGGVPLAGLTRTAAATVLERELPPKLSAELVIRVADRRFTLTPSTLGLDFDADRTAARALRVTAGATPVAVPLATTLDRTAVAARAGEIARSVARAPRSAALRRISSRAVLWTRARAGRRLRASDAAAALTRAAAEPVRRLVRLSVLTVSPATTNEALRRRYPSIVTVDKRTFTLRLFRNLRETERFRIAHGQVAYPTPSGRFTITSKQVNPNWYVPNSAWAGELGGTVVPGGTAGNPLKARWMGLRDGVGIHGTGDEGSIGRRASHGCVRMRVRDVKRLYRQVRVGTPVVIG